MPTRVADLVSKAWSYSLSALRHPSTLPKIAWGVLNGAHLGSLLAIMAQETWLDRARIATILDVGAHQGEFASAILRVLPEARVVSFEPQPDCHEKLAKRFSGNSRVRTFNVALGDRTGTAQFFRSSFSKSSSLLPMADLHRQAFPWSAESKPIDVPLDTLDRLATQIELVAPVLMKIDVQGAELRVLLAGAPVASGSYLRSFGASSQHPIRLVHWRQDLVRDIICNCLRARDPGVGIKPIQTDSYRRRQVLH